MSANDACSTAALSGVSTCLYDGSCITTSHGNRCQCLWGDRGATCDRSAWTFQPQSYIEHSDVPLDGGSFSVQMDVATVERRALLLLASAPAPRRMFVSVELINARVVVSYRGGDSTVQRVTAPPAQLSDGRWHHVVARVTNTVQALSTLLSHW